MSVDESLVIRSNSALTSKRDLFTPGVASTGLGEPVTLAGDAKLDVDLRFNSELKKFCRTPSPPGLLRSSYGMDGNIHKLLA